MSAHLNHSMEEKPARLTVLIDAEKKTYTLADRGTYLALVERRHA